MSYLSNYTPEDIFSHFIHGKVMEEKIQNPREIQFRNSSEVVIKKVPCSCSEKKIKEISS